MEEEAAKEAAILYVIAKKIAAESAEVDVENTRVGPENTGVGVENPGVNVTKVEEKTTPTLADLGEKGPYRNANDNNYEIREGI